MKIPEVLKSKKAQALLLGVVAICLKQLIGLSDEDVTKIVGLIGTYILGQGVADNGKEAVKVDSAPVAH